MSNAFEKRERALENQFFRTVDEALIQRMREKLAEKQSLEQLTESTGIGNKQLLTHLLEVGVNAETVVAFAIVPLVAVAWVDGTVEREERDVVLATALELGLVKGSVGYELLDLWLVEAPESFVFDAWCDYAPRIIAALPNVSAQELSRTVVKGSKAVAEATGGILGVAKKSSVERSVIRRVTEALSV